MALKDNLRNLRIQAGYRKGTDFADKIGVEYRNYMKYEKGTAWPSEETLIKIADGLNESIDKLLNYEPGKPDELKQAKGIAEMCGVKFHVPKDGFIQIDSIMRRKAPPNFWISVYVFKVFVFTVCDILEPELKVFRTQIDRYKRDRFAEVFRQKFVNYYFAVAKERDGSSSYVFDSPYVAEKYDKIPSVDAFIDKLFEEGSSTVKSGGDNDANK